MKKFLILAIACTTACLLHAQIPKSITLPKETVINPNPSAPEVPCNNFAGTFTLGQKGDYTRSNDLTLDTLFLCYNDSIFINHNGDFNLSGDPQPLTPPGVGFAFYTCEPTVTGPTLQDITGSALPMLPGDPCRLVTMGMPFDLLVTSNGPDGDTWFFNSQFLQNTYNMGSPMLVHFAPITFDDASNNGYEPVSQGAPPGPCVNVNTAAQFEVVYLNPITAVGFTNPFNGNSCLGRFKLEGGYPEYELSAKYDLNIYLKSDPSIKALVNNSAQQIKHGTSIVFSVPQSGVYVIEALDGKSCPLNIEVNVLSCNDADNIKFTLPQTEAAPGQVICLPVTTGNFSNIQGFTTSVSWDPALLQLAPGNFIQNINPDLLPEFDPSVPGSAETSQIGDGFLGLLYSGNGNATLGSSEVLMEVCFLVISQEDSICTPVTFTNQPSLVSAANSAGAQLAFEAINGEVCIVYDTVAMDIDILTPNCDGTTNVDVRISGGDAPYELTWQLLPGGATPSIDNIMAGQQITIPNLIPGMYQLIATPQNGVDIANADTIKITILANTLGAALDLSTLPSCNGSMDGVVTAIVFQGSTQVPSPWTGYTFTWNPPLGGPNQGVLTNVSSGPYAVTVTQTSTGCTAVASGTLPNPPVLDNGMVTITPATCSGVDDGEVMYEVEGGTPTPLGQYNIEILFSETPNDPNATLLTTVVGDSWSSTNLFTGYYTINVTDDNMCTFTDEIFVDAVRVVTLSEDPTLYRQPLCNGGMDGRLAVDVLIQPNPPGGPNFTFSWLPNGGAVQTDTPSSSELDGITAGTYTVTAVDDNGCSDEITLELFEPQPFTASVITSINPTCPNPTGGSVTVSGFGGSGLPGAFTYAWSDMGTGASRSGLMEGTYTVTATDANGCTATTSVTLALPTPPAITGITQVDVRCGGDGSLTVTAPTAVSYNWTSSNGPVPNPTSAAITGLDGGTYTVTVTDANGCTSSSTATLIGVEPLVLLDTTLNTPTCNGYLDGSIALGISGGTPGYTYNWDPANLNSPIILGLPAGLYTVTVTDSKQCTLVSEIELTEPPMIMAIASGPQKTTCFGDCDGEATLEVFYQQGTNFNFNWDNGSTDSLRTDLCTGINTVTITETSAAQCFIIFEVNVTSPPEIKIDSTESNIKNVTCFGDENGAINLAVNGGNGGPYSYAWQQGATTSSIQNLAPGIYVVTVTDMDGCTQEFSQEVGQPAPVVVAIDNAATMLISCFGAEDGKLAVITTGGNPPKPGEAQYTYIWSDGVNQIGTTNPIDMLSAGVYTVTVFDSEQCTGTTSLTLSDPPQVNGDFQLGEPLQCFGDETTIAVTNIAGGQGAPYSYTIDFGVPLDPTFTSTISGGEHYITYIDKQNCEWTDTIDVPEPPQILVTFDPPSIEIELGDSLVLTPLITGATGENFVWDPASALINPDTLFPTLYTFESVNLMLTITDEKGCIGKGTLPIEVDPNRNVYIPNIFIPGNSDGLNDFFTPFVGLGVETINFMQVFDRWGEMLYERKNFRPDELELTSGWDGRFKGKFVEPGVYVYSIEVLFLDKKKLLYRGDVTVIR